VGATLAALRDGEALRVVRWEDGIPKDVALAPLAAQAKDEAPAP